MMIRLHRNARTTPTIRAESAASQEPIHVLAQRCRVSPTTVMRWKHRDSVEDRPHTPYRLRTTLRPAQEVIAVDAPRRCCCRWTIFWRSCASSSTRTSPVRGWIVACAATG